MKISTAVVFNKEDVFREFLIFPLINPAFYKYSKYVNPYKQLDNIKKYLMRYYGYGTIKSS